MQRTPLFLPALAPLALLASGGTLSAQDDAWRWSVTPYAWATDVGIDAALAGRTVVNETIPVEDLLEDIDLTVQGRFELARGAHGVLLDLFYVSMSDEVNGLVLPQGAGTADLDWRMDLTIADLAATYDPRGDGLGLGLLYGARVIDTRTEVEGDFTTTSGTQAQDYTSDETLVDALFGLSYRAEVGSNLRVQSQLDVSTGGTELTWSAFPSLSYTFGGGKYAFVAGYRHMQIDFEEEGGLESEMTLSGPLIGFRFAP